MNVKPNWSAFKPTCTEWIADSLLSFLTETMGNVRLRSKQVEKDPDIPETSDVYQMMDERGRLDPVDELEENKELLELLLSDPLTTEWIADSLLSFLTETMGNVRLRSKQVEKDPDIPETSDVYQMMDERGRLDPVDELEENKELLELLLSDPLTTGTGDVAVADDDDDGHTFI
ncbi:hypothetical protein AHF37_04204 [Paragonimus kellicotti]|nr:hypothetical protein AHF37_04204 [Paragonimus kellicotti]